MKTLIIIPAYNEEKNIRLGALGKVCAIFWKGMCAVKFILVEGEIVVDLVLQHICAQK
jgi:hypothetical protein